MTPADAFDKLVKGNQRFKIGKPQFPNQGAVRRESVVKVQTPFAVIVACSDSRVAPEILFDQGIGDLFVIRVAGNVIGPLEMESIEYAAKYLHASCVLVMGHENCGAVKAVISGQTEDVRYIAQLINSSVIKAKASGLSNLLERATKLNAQTMTKFIKQSSVISDLIERGKLEVRSGFYDFDTGAVEIL